jgi:hypothetical protein
MKICKKGLVIGNFHLFLYFLSYVAPSFELPLNDFRNRCDGGRGRAPAVAGHDAREHHLSVVLQDIAAAYTREELLKEHGIAPCPRLGDSPLVAGMWQIIATTSSAARPS